MTGEFVVSGQRLQIIQIAGVVSVFIPLGVLPRFCQMPRVHQVFAVFGYHRGRAMVRIPVADPLHSSRSYVVVVIELLIHFVPKSRSALQR